MTQSRRMPLSMNGVTIGVRPSFVFNSLVTCLFHHAHPLPLFFCVRCKTAIHPLLQSGITITASGEYNARTYTCPPARRGGHRWQNQVFSSSLRVSLCAFSLPLLYSRPRPVTYKLETDTDICQPAVRDFFVRPVSVLARG